jgi:hypothetical protein
MHCYSQNHEYFIFPSSNLPGWGNSLTQSKRYNTIPVGTSHIRRSGMKGEDVITYFRAVCTVPQTLMYTNKRYALIAATKLNSLLCCWDYTSVRALLAAGHFLLATVAGGTARLNAVYVH